MSGRRIDLTGQTFNRLTVNHFLGMRYGGTVWECVCICGTRVPVPAAGLKSKGPGATKSCGFLKKETSREKLPALNPKAPPEVRRLRRRKLRPYEALYNGLVRNADRRGLSWGLTYETFCGLVTQTQCHYCYGKLHARSPHGPYPRGCGRQLDRKDNAQGYEESHVLSCCSGCNRAKGRKSYEFAITQRELWRQLRGDRISSVPLENPKRIYTNAARFERRSVSYDRKD